MRPLRLLAASSTLVLASLLLACVLLAPVAFAAGPAARSSKPHVPCRSARGTTTIAHSAKARIFTDQKTGDYYACLYKNGHPRVLSTIEHWEYEMVRFSGKYVAFVAFAESSNAYVGVLNMSTGRRHSFHEGEEVAPIKPPPDQCPSALPNCNVLCPQVDSLVLKPDGAVAWIAVNFPAPSPSTGVSCGNEIPPVTEVRRNDSRGLRVIGQGAGIEPASLRLHGSTLSWVDEGMSSTATLL